jgi:hypothetical protein
MASDLVPLVVVSIAAFELSPLRIVPAQILAELVCGGGGGGVSCCLFFYFF